MRKSTIVALGAAGLCLVAMPALALELDASAMLKAVFGTDRARELGVPIFVLIGVVTVLVFWAALARGKRRQKRMIDGYHAELNDYATKLRRNMK